MSKHKPRNKVKDIKNIKLTECYGLVYARVSSKRQEIEGTGLQSQEGRCKVFLEREGVKYDKTFPDSFSGGGDFMNRPAMRELLKYIDDNPHRNYVVVFDDLSRFARDTIFHLKLRSEFDKRGVILKCLNFNFEDSIEGKMVETIMAARNQYDRENNKRQVIQKQKARLENGYNAFPTFRGYKRDKDRIHGKLDKPNEKAKYIKEGLEGFANMVFNTKSDLARFWMDKGVISKKQGVDKALSTVDKMLRNVFYAGYIEYEPWEVKRREGYHEPLISLETYNKNQNRLSLKSSTISKKDIREGFELRGFIDCEGCSHKLSGAPSKSKSGKFHDYYCCKNKNCIYYGKSIKTKDVHEKFESLLKDLKVTDETLSLGFSVFEEALEDEIKERKEKINNLKVRESLIKDEINNLINLLSKTGSDIVIKQYENKIELLGKELEEIEEVLSMDYDYSEPLRTSKDELKVALKNPYTVWSNYEIVRKRRFFPFVFEGNLTYSREYGMRTPNYSLPIRMFQLIQSNDSVDVEVGGVEPPCN